MLNGVAAARISQHYEQS